MKMYVLVNKDLDMSVGKTAGQVAHSVVDYLDNIKYEVEIQACHYWKDRCDQTKIILGVDTKTMKKYENHHLAYPVYDLGKTELEPHTLTCICMGVISSDEARFLKRYRLL